MVNVINNLRIKIYCNALIKIILTFKKQGMMRKWEYMLKSLSLSPILYDCEYMCNINFEIKYFYPSRTHIIQ